MAETVRIVRETKDAAHPYVRVANAVVEDERLSFGARGMLCYLLSKPDGWQVNVRDLERAGGVAREARQRMMRELEQAGYMERILIRDKKGRFQWETVVHERPIGTLSSDGITVDGKTVYGVTADGEPREVTGEVTDLVSERTPERTNLAPRDVKPADGETVSGEAVGIVTTENPTTERSKIPLTSFGGAPGAHLAAAHGQHGHDGAPPGEPIAPAVHLVSELCGRALSADEAALVVETMGPDPRPELVESCVALTRSQALDAGVEPTIRLLCYYWGVTLDYGPGQDEARWQRMGLGAGRVSRGKAHAAKPAGKAPGDGAPQGARPGAVVEDGPAQDREDGHMGTGANAEHNGTGAGDSPSMATEGPGPGRDNGNGPHAQEAPIAPAVRLVGELVGYTLKPDEAALVVATMGPDPSRERVERCVTLARSQSVTTERPLAVRRVCSYWQASTQESEPRPVGGKLRNPATGARMFPVNPEVRAGRG